MTEEPSIIPPEQGRQLLREAVFKHLGEDWEEKWVLVTHHDYMARVNRGRINVDFYVDYFDGSVRIERREVNAGQDAGSFAAWLLLALFAMVVLAVASVLGYL